MRIGIIGGGAGGMMAACVTGKENQTVLFERNEKLGKKIYITGKGRCNLTNNCTIDEFLLSVRSNPKFLYSALRQLSPSDTIAMFNLFGLPTKIEQGNRVFPLSDKASDVTKALANQLSKNKVSVQLNSYVRHINIRDGQFVLTVNDADYTFNKIIVSTGGRSYPSTGSDGGMTDIIRKLGHTIVPEVPSLVSMETVQNHQLQGLVLKNVSVKLVSNGKQAACEQGELLFTHNGVSGPTVLTLSSYANRLPLKSLKLIIDLKPALDDKMLDGRLQRDFAEFSNKQFKNSLDKLLPSSLIPLVVSLSGINEMKAVNQITAIERQKLVKLLKGLEFDIAALENIDRAVVTAGGVSVKEINSSTMESKLIKGLYFAGEIIDVDALTGGYNLQIAFSTGYLAGLSCTKGEE